jgi:hypothetical protein
MAWALRWELGRAGTVLRIACRRPDHDAKLDGDPFPWLDVDRGAIVWHQHRRKAGSQISLDTIVAVHECIAMSDPTKCLIAAVSLAAIALPAQGEGIGWAGRPEVDQQGYELVFSPYTLHYSYDPDHRPVVLLGLSKLNADGSLYGLSLFNNSFGQPSAYGFVGRKYIEPYGWDRIYWAWTAGVIYGYTGEYEGKIRPNYKGFALGLVPRIGYQVTPKVSLEVAPLGASALMFSVVLSMP